MNADDEDSYEICTSCDGSGEGMYDGSRCSRCKGAGEVYIGEDKDDYDPPEFELDEALAWGGMDK